MKAVLVKIYLSSLLLVFSVGVFAQSDSLRIDSLKKMLLIQKEDSNKVNTLNSLSMAFMQISDYISSEASAHKALNLSEKLNFKKGKADALYNLAWFYYDKEKEKALSCFLQMIDLKQDLKDSSGVKEGFSLVSNFYITQSNYPEAISYQYKKLHLDEQMKDTLAIAKTLITIGTLQNDDNEAIEKYTSALKLFEQLHNKKEIASVYFYLGNIYSKKKEYEKALTMHIAALYIFQESKNDWMKAWALSSIGNIYQWKNNLDSALSNYLSALNIFEKENNAYALGTTYVNLGSVYTMLKKYTVADAFFQKAEILGKQDNNKEVLKDLYKEYSGLKIAQQDYKKAYEYYNMYINYRDSLSNEEINKKNAQSEIQYVFDKKQAVAKAEQAKKDEENKRIKNQQYFIIASLGIIVLAVVIIAFIQFRNNKNKQKANFLLLQEKEKVENTLSELKSTQSQLIQSEKMASLGELTAGIAHEIQNPLNFVNNFSEVSSELIKEMVDEVGKGNTTEVKAIADDLVQNLEKINHHGKRADAIVKGMLQHSRNSSGTKEPTDINALCDEYLRLAYHGLRAKDQSFNATLKTDFDENIGKTNIIPQDIGRVLLNLINNAFYAVNEKQNVQRSTLNVAYEPTVSITTKKLNNKIEISVADNGNGIPSSIKDKIFQPFFTTKPTGQGTGLGLSLSYDIITKGHDGTLSVATKEGEGSTFIIQLDKI